MGTVRNYACSRCRFCHEGLERFDALIAGPSFKVICHDCQELYDVSREGGWPEEGSDWLPTPQEAQCPKGAKHRAELWPEDRPCPKCGKPMNEGEITIFAD